MKLRHLQKYEECLAALAKLRNESRKTKPEGAKDIMPKACAEKQQLILAYQAQTQGYSAAVTALHNRTGRSSKTEYDAIYATAEDARMRATNAREALKTHTAEHGC
jgi:hypothetical protein